MATTTLFSDGIVLNNQPQSVTPYGPFVLDGGLYGIAVATSTGTATLRMHPGPDGATDLAVTAALGQGYSTVYLPPGSYNVLISTAPASISVTRIKLG